MYAVIKMIKITAGFIHIWQILHAKNVMLLLCANNVIDYAVKIKDDTKLCLCVNQ